VSADQITTILASCPGWALVGLTAPSERIREDALSEIADRILAGLSRPQSEHIEGQLRSPWHRQWSKRQRDWGMLLVMGARSRQRAGTPIARGSRCSALPSFLPTFERRGSTRVGHRSPSIWYAAARTDAVSGNRSWRGRTDPPPEGDPVPPRPRFTLPARQRRAFRSRSILRRIVASRA
jgi:hypothetical protein